MNTVESDEAPWKPAFHGNAGGSRPMTYRKKKPPMTEAQRKEQMKGISKAFIKPVSNGGWAKIDPVYVADSTSSEEEEEEEDSGDDEYTEDEQDLVALMRSKTNKIKQTPKQEGSQEIPRKPQITPAQKSNSDIQFSSRQEENAVSVPTSSIAPVTLPRPLRLPPFNTDGAIDHEQQYFSFFRQAATVAPFEYVSDQNILFVVRRPYGLESRPGLFERVSTTKDYRRKAHVSTLAALEVAVVMKPNLPVLLLFDEGHVRYRTSSSIDSKLQMGELPATINSKELSASALGALQYMDANGKPTHYSLDALAKQAQLLRQHYSSTITATANVLRVTKGLNNADDSATPVAKTPTRSVAVDTNDLVQRKAVAVDTSDLIQVQSAATNTVDKEPSENSKNRSLHHAAWWCRYRIPVWLRRNRRGVFWLVATMGSLVGGGGYYYLWMGQQQLSLPRIPSGIVIPRQD